MKPLSNIKINLRSIAQKQNMFLSCGQYFYHDEGIVFKKINPYTI